MENYPFIKRKYVITNVESKPTLLAVSKCNYCPFFKFDAYKFESFCTKRDPHLPERSIGKTNAARYLDGYQYPMDDIKLPDWCELSVLDFDCKLDDILYYKKGKLIVGEAFNCPADIDITEDNSIKYVGQNLVKTEYIKIDNAIPTPILKICSCCGEDKSDVDRTRNEGLCGDCLLLLDDTDTNKLNFIYINNFRLKRKSTYLNTDFKIVKYI